MPPRLNFARSVCAARSGAIRRPRRAYESPQAHSWEHIAQLSHYSADVRCEALKGLTDLLSSHPEVLPPIAPSFLQRTLLMCEDEYARVRKAALGVLRVAMAALERAGSLGPHEQVLRLRLQSAISHPERGVRVDALTLLQLLLQLRPSMLVPPPALLIPALADMLDAGMPQGDKAAATATEVATATIDACRALLVAQARAEAAANGNGGEEVGASQRGDWMPLSASDYVAEAQMDGKGGGGNEEEEEEGEEDNDEDEEVEEEDDDDDDDDDEAWERMAEGAWKTGATQMQGGGAGTVAQWQGTFAFGRWRRPISSQAPMDDGDGGAVGRCGSQQWRSQLVPLPTLLTRCWLECGVVGEEEAAVGGLSAASVLAAAVGAAAGGLLACRVIAGRRWGGGVSQRPWRRRRRRPCTGLRPGICRRVQAAADERSDRRCSTPFRR